MRLNSVLSRLNPEQYQAATSDSHIILVMAGAGSGKTSVLTSRIGHLQVNKRIGTANMLCLTFTRLAAGEMKERVASLIGDEFARNLVTGTFHSFCVYLLQQYAHAVKLERGFSVYDEEDRESLMQSVIKDLKLENKLKPSGIRPWDKEQKDRDRERVVSEYRYRLRQNNALDLEGLLVKTVELLAHENIAAEVHRQFTHVFVDEYQDTDDLQEQIIRLINPENLFVVGDPSQSIYGWRGTKIENILTFEQRYPGCEVIRLEQNYRSTAGILELANRTIAGATYQSPLQLRTDHEGPLPRVMSYDNATAEADTIAADISDISKNEETIYKEFAVLCRTNAQIGVIESSLKKAGIPTFVVSNRTSPLNAYDIRRILDYMAFITNGKDERALSRIINYPERRISDISLLKADPDDILSMTLPELTTLREFVKEIREYAQAWSRAREMFVTIAERLRMHQRYITDGLANRTTYLDAAIDEITRWEERQQRLNEPTDPYAFLTWLRTRDIQERLRQSDADGVRILTVHGAKGLEWNHVFVISCNDGVFPSKRSDIEEERRLFYVAVTRAREGLHLSFVREYESYGKVQFLQRSPFLN